MVGIKTFALICMHSATSLLCFFAHRVNCDAWSNRVGTVIKYFLFIGVLLLCGNSKLYALCPAGMTMVNQSGNADAVQSFAGIFEGAAGAARALGPPQGGGFSLTNWAFLFPATGELVLDMTDLIPENSTIVLRVGQGNNNTANVSTSNDLITFTAATTVTSVVNGANINYTVAAGSGGARYIRFQDTINTNFPPNTWWFAIDGITYSEICVPIPVADLSITKTDGSGTYTPGGSATYAIVVTNNGPDDVTGAVIADNLPNGVTLSGAWNCAASFGSSCSAANGGAIGGSAVSLSADIINGGVITVNVPVNFSSNMADY